MDGGIKLCNFHVNPMFDEYLTEINHMMYNASRQSSEMRGICSHASKMTRGQPGHFFVLITACCVDPATCR